MKLTLLSKILVIPLSVVTVIGFYSAVVADDSTSTTTTVSTSLPTTTAASTLLSTRKLALPENGKLTILEIGDSLGIDLEEGMKSELATNKKIRLINRSQVSTGLTSPAFYDWPTHFQAFLNQFHPKLVTVFFGANDTHSITFHGVSQPIGTAGWKKAYSAEVQKIDAEATAAGASVLWIGLPVMSSPIYAAMTRVINSTVESALSKSTNAKYLNTQSVLANATGKFAFVQRVNGVSQYIRANDGIHINTVGHLVLATYVVKQLSKIYDLPVVPAQPMTISY
jgi:uncharacterized protein